MATHRLEEGAILSGRYEILAIVGRGGMGTVYRSRDRRLDTVVAVKEMTERELTPDERVSAVLQFEREAKLLGQLSHPNLPRVFDYFIEEDRCYLVMEFVEGETLEARLKQASGDPLPVKQVLEWGVELADTLVYLHGQDPPIVFRDLKPANVMVTADGTVRLIDFGIARRFQAGATKDTSLYGSPGYSPPEQYGRTQTDPRSDIYALGATLHHLFTGRDPAPTPFKFPRLRALNAAFPPALDDLIDRCVQMEEGKRIQTAAEVRDILIQVRAAMAMPGSSPNMLSERSPRIISSRLNTAENNKQKRLAAIVGVIVLVVVATGLFAYSKSRGGERGLDKGTGTLSASTAPKVNPQQSHSEQIVGSLKISSDPTGAEALLDGKNVGVTPCDLKDVSPGKHTIKLIPARDSGLEPWTKEVEVHPGGTLVVDAALAASKGSENAGAPTVAIQSVQMFHTSARGAQGDAPGLEIIVNLRLAGAAGKACSIGATFYAADRVSPLKPHSENTEFATSDGHLGAAATLQPTTDAADFPDTVIFIPDSAFPVSYDQVTWRLSVYVDSKVIYEAPISPLQLRSQ